MYKILKHILLCDIINLRKINSDKLFTCIIMILQKEFLSMKKIMVLLFSVLMLSGCGNVYDTRTHNTADASPPSSVTGTEGINDMSLREKVGQMLMVRCDSITANGIKDVQPGGIIMFSSDFDNLSKSEVCKKIADLKNIPKITPYIAVDEEGGTVVRVSSHSALAPSKYESPQYYYNEGGMELVLENTREKSKLLTSLGINMNLAPVADVSQDPSHFIYPRAFGKNADETAAYVDNVVRETDSCNIASCLKHFPGYGGNIDTHTYVAVDERPISEFYDNDFKPFTAGINAGADCVLVAHNIVNAIDPTMPSTLSAPVHKILRDELDFDGIIMTDDMAMAAAANYEKPYKAAVLAGNDMLIVTEYDKAFNEILDAVKNGEIDEAIIDAAVSRILSAKQRREII